MTLRMVTLVLVLGGLHTGCGKHYWQSRGRGVGEFQTDSGQCIQEVKTKYHVVSEEIYRACMRTRGWERVQTQYPTNSQFRGPEDQDDFFSPPDPLSARGPQRPESVGDRDCSARAAISAEARRRCAECLDLPSARRRNSAPVVDRLRHLSSSPRRPPQLAGTATI
jgi:hypothetical protein